MVCAANSLENQWERQLKQINKDVNKLRTACEKFRKDINMVTWEWWCARWEDFPEEVTFEWRPEWQEGDTNWSPRRTFQAEERAYSIVFQFPSVPHILMILTRPRVPFSFNTNALLSLTGKDEGNSKRKFKGTCEPGKHATSSFRRPWVAATVSQSLL